MAEDAEEFLRGRKEIEEIKERIALLGDEVIGLQRALVESKAFNISQNICLKLVVENLRDYLSEVTEFEDMLKGTNRIATELNLALASLRGKLTEEAIPEDAYKYWVKDARRRLSSILSRGEVDSLIPLSSSSDWGKIIGFPGSEVEE